MSLPSHRNDLDTPRGKSRRGPFNWHLRRPEQGPVALAIKNRQCTTGRSSREWHRGKGLTFDVFCVDFIAMVGEYVGTVLFLMFAFGGTK
jgi:hypothetical protein